MGVTIHFEGNLKSPADFDNIVNTAKLFAETYGLDFSIFQEENKVLERVKDEQPWDYQGATKGLVINLPSCDPVNLEFDENNHVQEFCKTQFALVSIHILVIDLLRQIEPYFETLKVVDEGEYWESGDLPALQQNLDACFHAIEDAKQKDKSLSGPYRLSNGRIVDLLSDHD